jgi:hypothetical protein
MDIETFYDENEARRESAEFEIGDEWTDSSGVLYELSWVEATGELYLMAEPDASMLSDPFGGYWPLEDEVDELTIVVIGQVGNHEHLESLIAGWEDAMQEPNSLSWLAQRFPAAQLN